MAVILLTLGLSSHFLHLSASSSSQSGPPPFKKIYAFGDSFTDTSNTDNGNRPSGFRHISNHPYDITYFHRLTNRYSNDRLIMDFVAQSLSLPFLPPYRNLFGNEVDTRINFDVAGSTTINHDFFVKNDLRLDMTLQ